MDDMIMVYSSPIKEESIYRESYSFFEYYRISTNYMKKASVFVV